MFQFTFLLRYYIHLERMCWGLRPEEDLNISNASITDQVSQYLN